MTCKKRGVFKIPCLKVAEKLCKCACNSVCAVKKVCNKDVCEKSACDKLGVTKMCIEDGVY